MTHRAPGPRRRLTIERIADQAIDVIETDGLDGLSMRHVAEGLGVAPGTLYTYVANRAELEALVLDTVVARDGLPHELPGPWWDKVRAWARSDWDLFRARPWILALTTSVPTATPSMIRWLDSALRVFDDVAVRDQLKFDAIDLIDSYVHGASATHRRDDESSDHDLPEETLDAFAAAPSLQRALGEGAQPFGSSRFEFGLQCIIEGIHATFQAEIDGGPRR